MHVQQRVTLWLNAGEGFESYAAISNELLLEHAVGTTGKRARAQAHTYRCRHARDKSTDLLRRSSKLARVYNITPSLPRVLPSDAVGVEQLQLVARFARL